MTTQPRQPVWNGCVRFLPPDPGATMRTFTAMVALLLVATVVCAAPTPHAPPKMRPYSGIGVLMLTTSGIGDTGEPYPLYDEPAIVRRGELNLGKAPAYEWIFGSVSTGLPLVVMARKGNWLRVAYDDAGREAWLNPRRPAIFQPWDKFFKGQVVRLLPGLQKGYYQLFRQPGKGGLGTVTPKQFFKVVKLENDWTLVVTSQNSLGWLRWRDEDGRMLMGLGRAAKP